MPLFLQDTVQSNEVGPIPLRDFIAGLALLISVVNSIVVFYRSPKYLKRLEREKEANSRRVNVFKTLMATRGAKLSYRHVEALNSIDLEFLGDEYANVITARDNYYDNLSHLEHEHDSSFVLTWAERNNSLLATLLHEMGKVLNYKHSLVDI
ncbi:DUF6680 family protein [Hymenobacter metallicola]|uniref:DUF6680 domain-containing protein n=1 Tax=Hymenobacter metallicola TaxID=2563114 RepID=A0A4Z0Q354_9BACT|nr:DUF6680 family protein [Hymenobacter metallicola]TGE23531.1 hypothetical protein E5K02_20310 [Hymenobacter metallicola]